MLLRRVESRPGVWRIPLFAFEHRVLVLSAAGLLTVGACLALPRVRLDASSDSVVARDNPLGAIERRIEERFGPDEGAAVYAEDARPLAPEQLDALRGVQDALRRLPSVSRVDGPDASADGKAAMLRVVWSRRDEESRYAAIERILAPSRHRFERLVQLGAPATRAEIRRNLERDQRVILPATAFLLLTLLALGLRSLRLALFSVVNGGLATLWGLGAMAVLGIPVNLLSASIPALVIVVGGMGDVRIATEFRSCLRRHGVERLALFETTERIGLATLLSGVTTIIGFAATGASGLPILRDFGAAASLTMGLRLLCSIFVLPAELGFSVRALRAPEDRPAPHLETDATAKHAHRLVDLLAPRVRLVIVVLALVCAGGALAAMRVPRENDLLGFLGRHDPLVETTRRAESKLPGSEILNVVLEAAGGEFSRPEALGRLMALTSALRALPGVDSALSLADAGPDVAAPLVTADGAATRIILRTSIHDAGRLERLASAVSETIDSGRFGRYGHAVGGRALTLASAAQGITLSQMSSLGLAVAILFTIVSVLFLSLRCGFNAVLVNLVAVMLMFVLMGVLRIPLNIGTCMVAAVTLGLIIDDTLHLLVRYNRALRVHRDETAGIKAAFSEEFGPMLSTAGALAGGFAMLGWSQFVPVRQFGLLSAAVVLMAVVVESTVSPVLFANTRIVTLWDLISLSLRRTLQDESPLFAGLSRWQAKRLVLASDAVDFESGDAIVRSGEAGRTMYVILDGEVEVVRHDGGVARPVARLSVGDVFGEISLLREGPRTADVIAQTRVRALAFRRESLESLRRFSPYLASRLSSNIAAIAARR